MTATSAIDDTDTETTDPTNGPGTSTGDDSGSGSSGQTEFCEPSLPAGGVCPAATPPVPQLGSPDVVATFAPPNIDALLGGAPSAGGVAFECDVFAQDCPAGEKCMPWANDGGSNWNATMCTPVDPTPDAVGDTCTVEGSGVSGVDSCDVGAMCWNVDSATLEGTCVAMCTCSADNPICNEPNTACAIANDGALAVCLSACNPLDPDACAPDEGCYPVGADFLCAPNAAGGGGGGAGDECFNINTCDTGLVCVGADVVPGCTSQVACCAPTCTVGDDSPCTDGATCLGWYAQGSSPDPCWNDLGICGVPQ